MVSLMSTTRGKFQTKILRRGGVSQVHLISQLVSREWFWTQPNIPIRINKLLSLQLNIVFPIHFQQDALRSSCGGCHWSCHVEFCVNWLKWLQMWGIALHKGGRPSTVILCIRTHRLPLNKREGNHHRWSDDLSHWLLDLQELQLYVL